MSIYQFEDCEKLGFDRARMEAIPAYFDSYLDKKKFAGMSILVARDGKIAQLSHRGKMGFERDALDDEAIFRIYSMTKPITSVAIMQLYEQGRLMLTDPISKYIPAFKDVQVFESGTASDYTTRAPERMITLHDLMTHQAGLTYDFLLEHPVDAIYRNNKINGARSEKLNTAQLCEKLAEMPLLFSPGTAWNYSVATDVLGHIVELVSGQTLDAYFQQHIFDPLGMVDSFFHIPDEKRHRLMDNYLFDPIKRETRLVDSPDKTVYAPGREFLSGGGGLLSTMSDYFIFADTMRRGGTSAKGVRLLGRKTVAKMTSNQLPHNRTLEDHGFGTFTEVAYPGTGFGLGLSVIIDDGVTVSSTSKGNTSWGGLASTIFWNDPVEDMTVIMMTQLMPADTYPLRSQLSQLVYAALK
ncbi:MAG: serine hydrolase domain-containing protein [Parvibaculales bacterium]